MEKGKPIMISVRGGGGGCSIMGGHREIYLA